MSGQISASDLGLNMKKAGEATLFKWFLASYLFGKPIQQSVARRTYEKFMEHGLTTPRKIVNKTWQQIVDVLTEGHYRRLDESTARNLLAVSRYLLDNYDGKISNLIASASDRRELAGKLEELKGVGPKTAEIFCREITTG